MRVNNEPNIIPAGTVMNADINSVAIPLNQIFGYAIQIFFAGTPTGTFKLQSSCDANSGNIFPTNWTDISNSSFSVSAAGNVEWNVADSFYNWVRVVYTDGSSGNSTATITTSTCNIKGF